MVRSPQLQTVRQQVLNVTGREPAPYREAKRHVQVEEARRLGFPEVRKRGGGEEAMMSASHLRMDSGDIFEVSHTMKSGGFGSMCLANRPRDNTEWAVKKMRIVARYDLYGVEVPTKTHVSSPEALGIELSLLREMNLLEDSVWLDNGKVYAAMPLMSLDGSQLHARINHSFAVTAPERREYGRAFLYDATVKARALHHLGFVHLDIKSDNIFFRKNGTLELGDFGLAEPCTPDGVHLPSDAGSEGFIAPEVVLDWEAFYTSDVWSLAITWMDALVDLKSNPFTHAADPAKRGSYEDFQQRYASFARWRAALFDYSGPIPRFDIDRLAFGSKNPWDKYFAPAKAADPQVCAFLIERMLDPDPQQRASTSEILLHLDKIRRSGPGIKAMVRAPRMAVRAAKLKRRAQLDARRYVAEACTTRSQDRVVVLKALQRLSESTMP